MFKKLKKMMAAFRGNLTNYQKLDLLFKKALDDVKNIKVNVGQIQSNINNQKSTILHLREVEFQVFSQGGEDGIIQYLINKIKIPNKTFVEFGVENYLESNTRYLFLNNNWSGYIIDGDQEHIRFIEHNIASVGELYLKAAFITKENINELLTIPAFDKDLGILSIDIDGNDYWVWEAINTVNPLIVIAEYNSLFGSNTFWSVPYDPSFVRKEKHLSQLYYGASIQALCYLANIKGYTFIGCNSKGNNAFFVRSDYVGDFIIPPTPEEGYVRSKFREARNESGWITGVDRIKSIEGMEIIDVRTGEKSFINHLEVIYK